MMCVQTIFPHLLQTNFISFPHNWQDISHNNVQSLPTALCDTATYFLNYPVY